MLTGEAMDGVRAYGDCDGESVVDFLALGYWGDPCLLAFYDSGYAQVAVNLRDVISWLRGHHPELLDAKDSGVLEGGSHGSEGQARDMRSDVAFPSLWVKGGEDVHGMGEE